MDISSRTPEGSPTSCPLCGASVIVEPSLFFGDATCPLCGQILWFVQSPKSTRIFASQDSSAIRDGIIDRISRQLGVATSEVPDNLKLLYDQGVDSLDLVELVMELEDEFHLS